MSATPRPAKTNAHAFNEVYGYAPAKKGALTGLIDNTIRRIKRHVFRIGVDDFDWKNYTRHFYGPEQFREQLCYTPNLAEVDFVFTDNKLFTISDAKPIHYVHRVLYEAITNLPTVRSISEIGVGNGKHLVNFRHLLGPEVALAGYDINPEQIELFRLTFPSESRNVATGLLDITTQKIALDARPEVVFACTVLMHIKRREPYENALYNFLSSASRFAVIVDRQASHHYFDDLVRTRARHQDLKEVKFYYYDSGAYFALVISRAGEELAAPFQPLMDGAVLHQHDACG